MQINDEIKFNKHNKEKHQHETLIPDNEPSTAEGLNTLDDNDRQIS